MASAYIGTTFVPPLFGWIAKHVTFAIFPFFLGAVLILKIFMIESLNRKIDKKLVK
jgi:fucose permease